MSMSFDCKCLLTKLTTDNISNQMIVANKNSKSPSSFFAKNLASLCILESLLVSAT